MRRTNWRPKWQIKYDNEENKYNTFQLNVNLEFSLKACYMLYYICYIVTAHTKLTFTANQDCTKEKRNRT